MKSNHGTGRGSQSRRPQPQSFDASGLARPRHAESGDTPPHFGGKQASNINNPESPTTTWSTKVGAKPTPTSNLPTPSRAAIPQTFHTVDSDTTAPLPFESSPHLQLTGRFSGSKLPENEILFKQVFLGGELATRDCLLRLCTFASEQVRSNLGVALKHDDNGDPISVITRRTRYTG